MRGKTLIVVFSSVAALFALAVLKRRAAAAAPQIPPAAPPPAAEGSPATSELLPVVRGTNGRFTRRAPADQAAEAPELASSAPPSSN